MRTWLTFDLLTFLPFRCAWAATSKSWWRQEKCCKTAGSSGGSTFRRNSISSADIFGSKDEQEVRLFRDEPSPGDGKTFNLLLRSMRNNESHRKPSLKTEINKTRQQKKELPSSSEYWWAERLRSLKSSTNIKTTTTRARDKLTLTTWSGAGLHFGSFNFSRMILIFSDDFWKMSNEYFIYETIT